MEFKKEIIKAINKRVRWPHYRVFYFGSRVKGDADTRSDIDIGIEAPQPVPLEVMNEIKTDLEKLPILQQIDIVDFNWVSEEFKKTALENIEIIYEQ